MKAEGNSILIIIVALVAVAAIAINPSILTNLGIGSSIAPPSNVWEGCTWQPDYCFASCAEYGSTRGTYNSPAQCPTGADIHQCEINDIDFTAIGASELHIYSDCSQSGWFGEWTCTGFVRKTFVGDSIGRGQWLTSNLPGGGGASIEVNQVRKALLDTGLAGSSVGVPIAGAQGCSWFAGDYGYVWEDGTEGAKSIAFESATKFVCSQHLVSCPSTCTEPLLCAVPSHLKEFIVNYNGREHKAYVAGSCSNGEKLINIIGCKDTTEANICVNYDEIADKCYEYGDTQYSECGTISTACAGECAQNSDCGPTGVYYCDWNPSTLKGVCKPWESDTIVECDDDFDCTQTGSGCYSKVMTGISCINNKCVKVDESVGCCTLDDCPSDYFCNIDRECQLSQVEVADCPYDCCDQIFNAGDGAYEQKTCPSAESVCCPEHTCVSDASECSGGGGDCNLGPNGIDIVGYLTCLITNFWNWLITSIMGFLATLGIIAIIVVLGFVGFMILNKK